MVDIAEQLCIKSWEVTDVDGTHWKAEQGKTYTTTVPDDSKKTVIVFSRYWVPVPKEHFVLSEAYPPLTTP
jgi:uncharacterized protein affecting Mg2+/Co2+ transport